MKQGVQHKTRTRSFKALIFVACLLPAGALALGVFASGLGANPLETITHETGEWALRLLLVSLAITPLREAFGWNWLIQYRRLLGLFAFFYVCLHLSTYLVFDHFFDFQGILEDVLERPYITLGMTGFLLLLPLAVTSTNGWIRRLGRYWRRLHRIVYAAAIAGVLHFVWLVKADLREPLIYAGVLAALLGFRLLPEHWRKRSKARRTKISRPESNSASARMVPTAILEPTANAQD